MTTFHITNVRYRYIEGQTIKLFKLLPQNLLSFPLNVSEIIKHVKNVRLRTYQHIAETQKITMDKIVEQCQSESGCTFFDEPNNRYLIMYNNPYFCKKIQGRQLFTILHEIAHIHLNHFYIYDRKMIAETNLMCPNDKILELEADYYAATALAPFQIIKALNLTSAVEIQNYFGLSNQAAINRFKKYKEWLKHKYYSNNDKEILDLFKNYIRDYS